MFKFFNFKGTKCCHNFEIITRGKVKVNYYVEYDTYYHVTTAKCIECGYEEILDKEEVEMVVHDKLIKVHRDPLSKYTWFEREEALKDEY